MAEDGLLYGFLLDGNGGGRRLNWDQIRQWSPDQGTLWVHCEYDSPTVRRWLLQESGLDEVSAESLLAEETRPRCLVNGNHLLLTLRGINPNPESDPEDMVAIRLCVDANRVISTRRRRLQAATELSQAIDNGTGPKNTSEFVETITDKLTERTADVVDALIDGIDDLEEMVLTLESYEMRPKIAELRRHVVGLRRYLAPQREAVSRLHSEKVDWISDLDRSRLRESADRSTRLVEDLDLARERALVIQEELSNRLSEKMDRTMYVLSIVAAIFLPLGFLTGLFGINVGGIPGADFAGSFAIFSITLAALVVAQIWLFKRKKWM